MDEASAFFLGGDDKNTEPYFLHGVHVSNRIVVALKGRRAVLVPASEYVFFVGLSRDKKDNVFLTRDSEGLQRTRRFDKNDSDFQNVTATNLVLGSLDGGIYGVGTVRGGNSYFAFTHPEKPGRPLGVGRQYDQVRYDPSGPYFVFSNPETGITAFVGSEQMREDPVQPIWARGDGQDYTSSQFDRMRETWTNQIAPWRGQWIEQGKAVYLPTIDHLTSLIQTAHPGFRLDEHEVRDQIGTLLNSQFISIEKELRGVANSKEMNLSTLPLDVAQKRVKDALPALEPSIRRLQSELESLDWSERNTITQAFFRESLSLIWGIHKVPVVAAAQWDRVFDLLLHGYTPGKFDTKADLQLVLDFVQLLKSHGGDLAAISKILNLLTKVASISSADHQVVLSQMNRILRNPRYVEALLGAIDSVETDMVDRFAANHKVPHPELGDAEPYLLFLTNKIDLVKTQPRSLPPPVDPNRPNELAGAGRVTLSQLGKLQKRRSQSQESSVLTVEEFWMNSGICRHRPQLLFTETILETWKQCRGSRGTSERW